MADFKLALALLVLGLLPLSSGAYITTIHVPSVLQNENIGNLTVIHLNLTPGHGGVQVSGPTAVDADTIASAQTAAEYAASFLGLQEKNYNFNYTINDSNVSVSGPSGGLAFTLLAVAALEHRQLAQSFTATGTISSNGTIGLIGGITDKSNAASTGGMRFILVPYTSNGTLESLLYYISQQTNNIPVVEVANVSQALPYAFGEKSPTPLYINLTQTFDLVAVGNANVSCTGCNLSAFGQLVNYTFNITRSTVASLPSGFSSVKQQFTTNLNNYGGLKTNGFLYTSADFTFLSFINAFALANYRNYTLANATNLLANISSYCSSLVPPPLTTQNYEFVIGGRIRQYWANITLANAEQQLTSEQTTDDIVTSIYTAASALGWCKASAELYSIAPFMGGSYVDISPSLRSAAATAVNKARSTGSGIYVQTAAQAYNNGDYATALYAAAYANAFERPLPSYSTSKFYSETLGNIANATNGTWPSQFAIQSEFYFRQSFVSHSGANDSMDQAYTTSVLAAGLQAANGAISSSFTITNQSVAGMAQQISGIEQQISQIYEIMLVNAGLLFAVLMVLLVHMLPRGKKRRG
ncbi:MAG: hypothetical protein KGH57_03365 [Candidatus Micrarchaeota archaeon]|nr:hypothetical protein [Candidatus Micrarchaeota archaeon]